MTTRRHEVVRRDFVQSVLRDSSAPAERMALAKASPEPTPSLVAGPIVKAREETRFLISVVYAANEMPGRGADGRVDVASPEVLEKAAWRFAIKGFRVGIDHRPGGEDAAHIVESWIHRGKPWTVTAPDGSVQTIRKGTWLVGMILSEPAWRAYKAGRFGGLSLQGSAGRKPASARTLARLKG